MEILSKVAAPIIVILFFFVVLFTYTKFAGPVPFSQIAPYSFYVTGQGKVEATPDSAVVRLGVVAKAQTAEQAQNQLNQNINKVIEAIKALGISEEKIKTENFTVYPDYNYPKVMAVSPEGEAAVDENRITGYTGTTDITVSLDQVDLANKVIDAGSASGANQIGGVEFKVENDEAALNKARELAVADARKKAEDAARIAGFKLGKVINYTESQNGWGQPMMAKRMDSVAMEDVPTNVQPGTNEIVVNVDLSYEIR